MLESEYPAKEFGVKIRPFVEENGYFGIKWPRSNVQIRDSDGKRKRGQHT